MLDGIYRGMTGVMGLVPGPWWPPPHSAPGPVAGLLHGASAGEVKAARAVWPFLLAQSAGERWELSTGTEAGIQTGATCRLPRDIPQLVSRFLDDLQPRALVLVEGEIWPNLLRAAADRSIPVGILGARISPRSLRRWGLIPGMASSCLQRVEAFAAASTEDGERLISLGVPPSRIEVTGWLKWPAREQHENVLSGLSAELVAEFSEDLSAAPLVVLGSVHPGEVARAADVLSGTQLGPGRARWLVVPRHQQARQILKREARRTCPPGSVMVEGRFGVLRHWYRLADAALVGGGARGDGVHDLLEPLQCGLRPMCFLRRGDPGSVGAVLQAEGLALALDTDARPASTIAAAAIQEAPDAWGRLQKKYDGREAAVNFLASRGVLAS